MHLYSVSYTNKYPLNYSVVKYLRMYGDSIDIGSTYGYIFEFVAYDFIKPSGAAL